MAANPLAHKTGIAAAFQPARPGAGRTNGTVSRNGSVISTIVTVTVAAAIFLAAGAHCRWLPMPVSSANGIRNLTEALNHSQ